MDDTPVHNIGVDCTLQRLSTLPAVRRSHHPGEMSAAEGRPGSLLQALQGSSSGKERGGAIRPRPSLQGGGGGGGGPLRSRRQEKRLDLLTSLR